MAHFYNEFEHPNVIEMIFNQIILKQFEKEYFDMINVTNNIDLSKEDDNNKNQRLVFSSKDLMCLIMHYLGLNFDFGFGFAKNETSDACSLVSSYWLCHRWNPHSIYHCNIKRFTRIDPQRNSKISRAWQRVAPAKSICIFLRGFSWDEEEFAIDLIKAANNFKFSDQSGIRSNKNNEMTNINGISGSYRPMISRINDGNSLGYTDRSNMRSRVGIDFNNFANTGSATFGLPPTPLPTGTNNYYQDGILTGTYRQMNWSDIVNETRMKRNRNINTNINKNNQHSGPVILHLDAHITFPNANQVVSDAPTLTRQDGVVNFAEDDRTHLIGGDVDLEVLEWEIDPEVMLSVKKLVQKLTGLEKLKIDCSMGNHTIATKVLNNLVLLFFWKCLNDIIAKNDIQVILEMKYQDPNYSDSFLDDMEIDNLSKIVQTSWCKIDSIKIDLWENSLSFTLVQLISNSRAKQLVIDVKYTASPSLPNIGQTVQKQLRHVEMLKYSQTRHIALDQVYQVLNIDVIQQGKLFIVLDLQTIYRKNTHNDIEFNLFCNQVFSLIVTKRVPIDIKIQFLNVPQLQSQFNQIYFPIYLKYFGKDRILKEYKPPKCNQSCKPLQFLYMKFEVFEFERHCSTILHVKNAAY